MEERVQREKKKDWWTRSREGRHVKQTLLVCTCTTCNSMKIFSHTLEVTTNTHSTNIAQCCKAQFTIVGNVKKEKY